MTLADVLEVFGGDFLDMAGEAAASASYLEPMSKHRGGVGLDYGKIGAIVGSEEHGKWVTVENELRKVAGCSKTALGMVGVNTGSAYWKFIHCYRWMCAKCGSKNGRIHKKRFSRIIPRLLQQIEETTNAEGPVKFGDGVLDLRQFVFTVPEVLRVYFQSRAGISALCRMAERIIKKMFPGRASLRYFHGFGNKKRGVFHPHVNIHSFEVHKQKLELTRDELKELNMRYRAALQAYVYQVHGVRVPDAVLAPIKVFYSFVEGDRIYERKRWNKEKGCFVVSEVEGYKLLIHRIEYMSRPCPGYADFDSIKNDEKLLKLFVLDMKGFHYITNCGSWKLKDCDRQEEMKEAETLAGEPLRVAYDNQGHVRYISRGEFDIMYRVGDYEELSDGFYRIKKIEKKKAGGKKNARKKRG